MAAISARDLAIAIAGRELLHGVTFDVAAGEMLAVVGPNGIGKTTLLRTIAGAHPLAQGSVSVGGQDLHDVSWRRRAQLAACAFGDDHVPERISVRETVASGRFAYHSWWDWAQNERDAAAVDEALAAVAMSEFCERDVRTLSAGERQRVWIALALAQSAPVLLLDEPTSHLDARYAIEILGLLRSIAHAGRAIIAVLHDLNEASLFADTIALFAEGKLLALGPASAVFTPPNLRAAYAIDVEVFPDERGRVRILPHVAG